MDATEETLLSDEPIKVPKALPPSHLAHLSWFHQSRPVDLQVGLHQAPRHENVPILSLRAFFQLLFLQGTAKPSMAFLLEKDTVATGHHAL
jgi:hypothetical protein